MEYKSAAVQISGRMKIGYKSGMRSTLPLMEPRRLSRAGDFPRTEKSLVNVFVGVRRAGLLVTRSVLHVRVLNIMDIW